MASSSESSTRATVVIVGAGAAGIFTAYQIATQHPGAFDVRIFEAAPVIGGNVSSVTAEYGGQTYVIDAGAECYYPNPQPHYVQLVGALGLTSTSYPAGFTIWESSTGQRLLWIPSSLGRFARYTARDWEAFFHFCGFVVAATWLNAKSPENWTLSVSDWLAGIPHWLMPASFAPVIEAFLYQFVSLPMGQIGQSSALYATTYFVRNIFGTLPKAAVDDTPTFSTYAWLGALRPPYGSGEQIPVFKSWGAPVLDPASCSSAFYSHTHNVLLPTTTFMQLRRQLLSA